MGKILVYEIFLPSVIIMIMGQCLLQNAHFRFSCRIKVSQAASSNILRISVAHNTGYLKATAVCADVVSHGEDVMSVQSHQ